MRRSGRRVPPRSGSRQRRSRPSRRSGCRPRWANALREGRKRSRPRARQSAPARQRRALGRARDGGRSSGAPRREHSNRGAGHDRPVPIVDHDHAGGPVSASDPYRRRPRAPGGRPYTRRALRIGIPRRRRPSPLRPVVRVAAAAALAAAVAVPLARRRLRIPAGATVAATAAGPFALAVLFPRTRGRDAALFALQMWAFTIIHELPYDHPDRLRARLRVRYPITVDRFLGAGELPNVRLQRAFSRPGEVRKLDRVLAIVHWAWFFEPHLALTWILLRDNSRFPRAARQMGAAFDLGCAIYFAVPTAPPWWAAEQGYVSEHEGHASGEIVAAAAPPRL